LLLTDFYNTIKNGLQEKLAAVLFQLPAQIIFSEELLKKIVDQLDPAFINVVEFRHSSWWQPKVYETLARHHIHFAVSVIHNYQMTLLVIPILFITAFMVYLNYIIQHMIKIFYNRLSLLYKMLNKPDRLFYTSITSTNGCYTKCTICTTICDAIRTNLYCGYLPLVYCIYEL
jgi:hypothetical protein